MCHTLAEALRVKHYGRIMKITDGGKWIHGAW